jgi:hypothetical protein
MKYDNKTNGNIARTMAKQSWGDVNRQRKILDGIWDFGCSGHGGYIVDINLFPKCEPWKDIVYFNYNKGTYYPSKQHFAIFEEDCNWAILEYLYPEIAKKKYNNKNNWTENFYIKYPKFEDYFNNGVIACLQRWNSEILKTA